MVLSLTVITVIVGALLGFVSYITEEPIAQAAVQKQQKAIAAVVPVEGATVGEPSTVQTANGMDAIVFPVMKDGALAGTAVQAVSKNGFGGNITVMFGFAPDGTILGYNVLDCGGETPGLGAKMVDWFVGTSANGERSTGVVGKNPGVANMTVSKDGGEVDAITAATISSRAFCDAIAQAYGVLTGAADVQTGATTQQADSTTQQADSTAQQADSAAQPVDTL